MENTLWGPIKIRATAELLLLPPLSTYTAHNQKGCMYECCCCSIVSFECTRHWLTWKEMKQKTKLVSIQFYTEVATLQSTTPYCAVHTYVYFHASTRLYTYVYMSVHVCVHVVYISTSPNWIKIYPKKKEKETRRFLNVFFEIFANKCFPVFLSTQCF